MALVDDEHQLDLLVDVQQALHEEGVGDLVLLPLVVLEARTVVKCHVLNHHLRRHRCLRILLVTYFYLRRASVVQSWLETLVPHHQVAARKERHDGALAHSGIADHQHALGSLLVDGNSLQTVFD